MRRRVLAVAACTALCLLSLCTCVQAWEQDATGIRTVISVPSRLGLASANEVPVELAITAADGKPFSGQVDLWAEYGRFIGPDGTLVYSPLAVTVDRGRASARVSLADLLSVSYPLAIYVTMGPYGNGVVLGQASVDVRYAMAVTFSEESVLAAKPDGVGRPLVVAVFFDQFGEPMEDLRVRVHSVGAGVPSEWNEVRTGAGGRMRAALPARTERGYATCQFFAGGFVSPGLIVAYSDAPVVEPPAGGGAVSEGFTLGVAGLSYTDSSGPDASAPSPTGKLRFVLQNVSDHSLLIWVSFPEHDYPLTVIGPRGALLTPRREIGEVGGRATVFVTPGEQVMVEYSLACAYDLKDDGWYQIVPHRTVSRLDGKGETVLTTAPIAVLVVHGQVVSMSEGNTRLAPAPRLHLAWGLPSARCSQ